MEHEERRRLVYSFCILIKFLLILFLGSISTGRLERGQDADETALQPVHRNPPLGVQGVVLISDLHVGSVHT